MDVAHPAIGCATRLCRTRAVHRRMQFQSRSAHNWTHTNPHIMHSHSYQRQFRVNVWAEIIRDHLIGPYLLPMRLDAVMYLVCLQEVLPVLLQSVPANIKGCMWLQHDARAERLEISAQMCEMHCIQHIQNDGLDGFDR
ncbi:uncharacterized protein TNCV_1990641 [Trichonephila clavipes]|nr:uncharacterized protein TNCV_1990641 [Trichonephila clavipes]